MFAKSMTLSKADIDRAFTNHEFVIAIQPQVDVADGSVAAAEAFVRWNHPGFGMMTPQLFLPFIEAHGESPRLLDAVVRLGLQAADALAYAGHDWRISINLGAADLQTGVAPDVITAALRDSRMPAGRLVVEAPEAALTGADPLVRQALERLRGMGCGIALDSGGALPLEAAEAVPELFTEVKIGGAAIIRFAEIARKVDGGRIARRLAFARKHGLRAVAVGVETEKTLAALVKLGFGAVQGALIAKPQPLDALLAWDGEWRGETPGETPVRAPLRTRPRLVSPAPTAEPAAPKLVEQLMPGPFRFDDVIEDDAIDVDFDDDAFEAPAPRAAYEAAEEEHDPSADEFADGEELNAMNNAAPLHAGMIERPRQRAAQRVPAPMFLPAPEVEETAAEPAPDPLLDRPLALRMRTPPEKVGMFDRMKRFLRR